MRGRRRKETKLEGFFSRKILVRALETPDIRPLEINANAKTDLGKA